MKTKTTLISVILAMLILTACSSRVPRKDLQNLPSLIEIKALDFAQNTISLRVSHRNRATREDNQLSCQLSIKDHQTVQFSGLNLPDLTTYAVETVTADLQLQSLEINTKQSNELSYALDCFLFSSNFRTEQIINKAIVYRVPGEPDTYR